MNEHRTRPPAVQNLAIHHFSISVPDIAQAISWYGDILGFDLQVQFEIEAIPAKGAFMKRDDLRLELWQAFGGATVPEARREPDSDLRMGGTKHVAFAVPDLQKVLVELMHRGVDIAAVQRSPTQPMRKELDPASSSVPAFAAFIRDPAGTLIELLDEDAVTRQLPP